MLKILPKIKNEKMKYYLKTTEAAEYLSVDISFLKKNMGGIFQEGIHYYRAPNARIIRWKINALDSWMQGKEQDCVNQENTLILQQLLK